MSLNALEEKAVTWFFQCKDYYKASMIIVSSDDYHDPVCTLQSFSIECALKSLLALSSIEKTGHDLHKLFGALPEALKKELKREFQIKFDYDLESELADIKLDFVDSRYCLTDPKHNGGKSFSVHSLRNCSSFLYEFTKIKVEHICHRYVSSLL